MKAVLIKDLSYPYTSDLKEGEIIEILDSTLNHDLLIETKEKRLVPKKAVAFLIDSDTNVMKIYRTILNLLDKAEIESEKREIIIGGLKEIYKDLK